MVKQIQAAQKAARKAIEATYFGTLTVTELQKVKNEKSKLMEESEVVVFVQGSLNLHQLQKPCWCPLSESA